MGLEEVKEWLHYCGRCNSCKYLYRNYEPSCPAFEKYQWESYTSSGKVWMARDLYEQKYPLTESIRDKVFSCTLCGNCTVQCQQEISNHALDIFEALREECVENDLIKEEHLAFRENIQAKKNPYGIPQEDRFEGIDEKYFKESAEVFFFVGCTTALRNKDLFHDALVVLDYFDVDFTLSKEEWCCGSPLLTTGQMKYAEELATHNVDLFKKMGVKTVVTACAGCFRTLKKQYPEKFDLLDANADPNTKDIKDIEILHLSQFLPKIIKKNSFSKADHKMRVTYHDPCHLGRHMKVYNEPRSVIKEIKGVNFKEMPRNHDNSWCCGAGAGVKSGFKDWAVEIAEQRIQEAISINQDGNKNLEYLITTCPFCERNLSDGLDSMKNKKIQGTSDLEVIDLIQFVKKFLKHKK